MGEMWLSVVIPIHGVEEFLKECLDSVFADPGHDFEVIAIDDASPDGSREILASYGDPRMRVITQTLNVGLGPARNIGLHEARGDYVWFVDGDDWIVPGALDALRDITATSPDVVVIGYDKVSPDGDHTPVSISGPDLLRLHTTAWNKIVRREFLVETGLKFPRGWYEDLPYSQPLLLRAQTVRLLDRVCYHYRTRPSAITHTASERQFEVFGQYDRLFEALRSEDEPHRGELCELMVSQLLVMLGNPERVPAGRRRGFFHRISAAAHRHAPRGWYAYPGGSLGLKHRLVRWNLFTLYAMARRGFRLSGGHTRRS